MPVAAGRAALSGYVCPRIKRMSKTTMTLANRARFLREYAKCGIIGEAARRAKTCRESHWDWLKDPEYKLQFAAAHEQAIEALETELHRRVNEGTEETVVYQGEISYQRDAAGNLTNKPLIVKRKSDILLMFALKGAKPEKYRDNVKADITHTGELAITHRIELTRLNDAALDQLEAMFRLPAPESTTSEESDDE